MTEAEFARVMNAYWHSLEGMEHVRRVSFYIAKQEELDGGMAAMEPQRPFQSSRFQSRGSGGPLSTSRGIRR